MAENEKGSGEKTALYDESAGNGNRQQLKLMGNEIAVQFSVSASFTALEIQIPKATATGSKGAFTAKLFSYDGSYGSSIKGKAIAEQHFEGYGSGETAVFDIAAASGKAAGAGEYILFTDSGSGNIHLGLTAVNAGLEGKTRVYYNASALTGKTLCASIVWETGRGELKDVSENNQKLVTSSGTWVVTDGLGRQVENSYTDTRREGKTVGLFFHTWHTSNGGSGTRNITSILKEHPEIQNDYSSKLWGNAGSYFWNEPIWGYYKSNDEWVLRRQAELLADAGVDAVFFDNTNGTATFIDDVLTLCKVWSKARADGVNTPKISFMLPMFDYNDVAVQLREIYKKLYGAGLYQELWFYWKGKPLIVGYPGKLDASDPTDKEIIDFFNYRVINHSQSADNIQVQDEDGNPLVYGAIQQEIKDNYQLWNWISVYPQLVNKNPDGTPEQVAVAIAHNWCAETHLTAMNNPKFQVFGRHYDPVKGAVDTRENAKLYGAYFSAQWEYALNIDPEFIWVTGWNEWVAGRFKDFWGVENAFPDNFSDEYSRDIEPSRGDLKDHYYYLLVSFIRKYKGTPAASVVKEPVTVDVSTGSGWDNVTAVYESYSGDTEERNAKGYVNNETGKNFVYTNTTGRNDIVQAKAAFDDDNIYFMAETADELTPYTDPAWMRLLIEIESTGGEAVDAQNWESFQYIVGRENSTDGVTLGIERSTGGWNWEKAGEAQFGTKGNRISVAIPRAALGLSDASDFVINFKWSDNMQVDGDILDFYVNGDVAPEGRYKYQFAVGSTPKRAADEVNNKKKSAGLWIAAGIAAAAAVTAGIVAAVVMGKKKKEQGK